MAVHITNKIRDGILHHIQMYLYFEQLIQKGKYRKSNKDCHHAGAAYDEGCFHQKLECELFPVAAKHFSNAHFFGTIDRLRGGEVNEIDAGDHDQEDADERECSNQGMTERMTVIISKAVIKMNFGQGLKDITIFRILSGLVFFRKGCQVRIEFLRRETIRQNNKCISASESTDPVCPGCF